MTRRVYLARRGRVVLVELPEHPEVGQHLLLVLRHGRVPEVERSNRRSSDPVCS